MIITADTITSKQRSKLRSLASNLQPVTQIGKGGVTDNLLKTLSDEMCIRDRYLSGSKQLFLSGLAAGIENACGYGESGGFSPVGGRLDGISLFSERDL